ncbi:MAG: alpha/beta hydrolase [Candidatus Omnitrophota bacterium]|nr:alpha/beta hydrolase [Candidatus Omnitrophota bacterium]
MPYIKTRQNLIWHYKLKGKGKALLFIHGWGADLGVWQQQLDFFSKHYKTVAVDLPGHGMSGWRKIALEGLSKDINFILNKIGIDRLTIIAASLGGLIALKFASMFPERLERLILVDTAARFPCENEKEGITKAEIKKLSNLLDKDFTRALLYFARSIFTNEERRMYDYKKGWDILTRRIILPQKRALKEYLRILEVEDLSAILPQIKVNTLIINGEKDYICSPQKAKMLRNALPAAQLKIVKNCGHLPFLSQPKIFNQILEEFLKT